MEKFFDPPSSELDAEDRLAELVAPSNLATVMALRVFATLRLADLIAGARSTTALLAAYSVANEDALWRLLRFLAGHKIVTIGRDGTCALTSLGECLRTSHPSGFRARLDLDAPTGPDPLAFTQLLTAVRTGEPAYRPPTVVSFDRAIAEATVALHAPVIAEYDWTGVRTVVDVGGGPDTLLPSVLRGNPGVRGILVEKPEALARAQEAFARAGLSDRLSIVVGSALGTLPAGFDVYMLPRVLRAWSDDEARRILGRCARAAAPNGRVLVTGQLPPDEAAPEAGDRGWLEWTESDLFELVSSGGRERTLPAYEELARDAGMRLRRLPLVIGRDAVMECVVEPD